MFSRLLARNNEEWDGKMLKVWYQWNLSRCCVICMLKEEKNQREKIYRTIRGLARELLAYNMQKVKLLLNNKKRKRGEGKMCFTTFKKAQMFNDLKITMRRVRKSLFWSHNFCIECRVDDGTRNLVCKIYFFGSKIIFTDDDNRLGAATSRGGWGGKLFLLLRKCLQST